MATATPFIGRTAELHVLQGALTQVDNGTPCVLELLGSAGIGKTRLLAELATLADARGHLVLSGRAAEFERELPFWPFVDALDEYVAGLDPRRLARLDPSSRAELGDVLPSLAATVPAATGLHERYRIHRAVRALLEHLAASRPLVLVLDDFHWADAASTDLAVALLRRPPSAGVLIALGARPRQLEAAPAAALEHAHRTRTLTRIELGPLTREQAGDLVGAGSDSWYEDAAGNPFYLEQLARTPQRPRSARGGAATGADVPSAVAAALAEELAALPDTARQLLDGAAVAGDPFELDLAASAAPLAESAALEAVDVLLLQEFVQQTDAPRRFRFRHPIVRRAVYEASPAGWRLGAHERVAAALRARGASAEARAHHVERSARHGDGDAIAMLCDAGAEAAPRAPVTAAHWLGAALRLLPDSAPAQQRVAILLPRAQALAATGQFEASHTALLESIAIAPASSPTLRSALAASCAHVEHLLGHHEQAHERLQAALNAVPDHASPEALTLMIELTMDGAQRMDYTTMEHWGARAATVARRTDDPVLAATGVAAYARAAAFAGAVQEAEAACTEARQLVDALTDDELAGRLDAAVHLAGGEFYRHRFEAVGIHTRRALKIGRATGQGQLFPLVYALLGMVWWARGELAEAVEPLDGAIESARISANAEMLAWSLYARSMIALAAGDVETALTTAQEAFDLTGDEPSHIGGWTAYALATASLQAGRPERSAELLERSAGGADLPRTAATWRASALEVLAQCRLALGDVAAARRAAERAADAADAVALPIATASAMRAAAAVELASGDPANAASLGRAAATGLDGIGLPIEAALARLLSGRALAQAGDADGAAAELDLAVGSFERCGAHRYRQEGERELRKLGRHIHHRSPTGPGSLTRRELEVAHHIVDRKTNREIAATLFLSQKTVETHIRNIFAKLDASSRVEVARIVARTERQAAPVRD